MHFKSSLTPIVVTVVLLVGACSNGGDRTATVEPAVSPSVASSPMGDAAPAKTTDHSAPVHGGQVVEVGPYHLELVAAPEGNGTHLDLFLQTGDTHQAIEGATVTGQVQLPDGSQKQVEFDYDAPGKHYVALLPDTPAGEYKVVILTDIKGEKVNGRFNFTK